MARMPGFPTNVTNTRTGDFITDFADLVRQEDPGVVAEWLFSNANEMSESMFFDSSSNWDALEAPHILIMRAAAPTGVFTLTAKSGYLTAIDGDVEKSKIANSIFGDDYDFFMKLPRDWQTFKGQLVAVMQLAYRRGIRRSDSRVQRM